jgi:hypothetical protein
MQCHKTASATKRVMLTTMENVVIIFDCFFRDAFYCAQYRTNAAKLVWVNPRILVYGKRRSRCPYTSQSATIYNIHLWLTDTLTTQ